MRFLGFLFRLLLIGLALCALALLTGAYGSGEVQIVWFDKIIETSAAFLSSVVLAAVFVLLQVYRLWRFLWDGPKMWRLKRRARDLEEGQKEIMKGLAALAGGDAPQAGVHALRARRVLGEGGAVRFIQAQAACLAGDSAAAKTLWTAMTADPDTAVLGYRGLITAALKAGDSNQALGLVQRLEKEKGALPWTQELKFRLDARLGNWSAARLALEKARKARALPKEDANRHEAALLLAQAKEALKASQEKEALSLAEKARALAGEWVPTALILAEAQIVAGSERAALRVIERTWRRTPHPQLVPLALWAHKSGKPIEGFQYVRKLVREKPQDPAALMALAEAALKADLWGEARRALMALLAQNGGTRLAYQMLARLERHETGDERAASTWLARGLAAQADPAWLCGACGAAHAHWDASCSDCGAFNKMAWATPGKARAMSEREPLLLPGEAG